MFILLRILIISICINICGFVYAGSYFKIQNIDTDNYPEVIVDFSFSHITPIHNLESKNIKLYENGWEIKNFELSSRVFSIDEAHSIILLDTSLSLSSFQFQQQKKLIKLFLDQLKEYVRVTIISFGDRVNVHCRAFAPSRAILECLDIIEHRGQETLLYDAIHEAIIYSTSLTESVKYITVFTDGRDEGSIVTLVENTRMLQKETIPIFIMATGNKSRIQKLSRLISSGHGKTFYSDDTENLKKVFGVLEYLIQANYSIVYSSHNIRTSETLNKNTLEIIINKGDIQDGDQKSFILEISNLQSFVFFIKNNLNYVSISLILFMLVGFILYYFRRKVSSLFTSKIARNYFDLSKDIPIASDHSVTLNTELPASFTQVKHVPSTNVSSSEQVVLVKDTGLYTEQIPKSVVPTAMLIEQTTHGKVQRKFMIYSEYVAIGSADENDIVLADPTISYKHAEIRYIKNDYFLFDLFSEKGTLLNKKKILRPKPIRTLDEIQIGKSIFYFQVNT